MIISLSPITCHIRSTRTHAHILHCLEEFSFCLNGGCDDDFGLLKFGKIARAHVAHARGNGADQVLAAIIDLGRPVKNLFERPGGANPDAGDKAPPDDYQDFLNYAVAVAKRYQGRIYYYQIWNEPNANDEWGT